VESPQIEWFPEGQELPNLKPIHVTLSNLKSIHNFLWTSTCLILLMQPLPSVPESRLQPSPPAQSP
jgi:hypothetical protein